MNIIQIVERIKSYLDIVGSPRHDWVAYEMNIMTAINQIVNDRIDAVKKDTRDKKYAFQSRQRLRDELYTIVVNKQSVTPTLNTIPANQIPANFRFLLNVFPTISGTEYVAEPTSYNERREINDDPYRRAQLTEPYRIYYIESSSGIELSFNMTSCKIDYIKNPAAVSVGQRYTSAQVFAIGNVLIATEPTVYHGNSYDPGDEITIVAGFLSITSGEVCFGYTNSDLPAVLHEEIAKVAAGLFEKTVEDYNKGIILEKESEK
jgi:hypothetical protein